MSEEIRCTHELPELFDAKSRVLILGSFPSVISRKQKGYYANPSNRFWKVLSAIYHEEITDRNAFCHAHHIALWDVIESCVLKGSSDQSIREVIVNPIDSLVKQSEIQAIFLTGKKALQLYETYIECDVPYFGLPSTSGANAAMSLEQLIQQYEVIYEYTKSSD